MSKYFFFKMLLNVQTIWQYENYISNGIIISLKTPHIPPKTYSHPTSTLHTTLYQPVSHLFLTIPRLPHIFFSSNFYFWFHVNAIIYIKYTFTLNVITYFSVIDFFFYKWNINIMTMWTIHIFSWYEIFKSPKVHSPYFFSGIIYLKATPNPPYYTTYIY